MSDEAKVAVAALAVSIVFGLYNVIQNQRTADQARQTADSERETADLAKRTDERVTSLEFGKTRSEVLRQVLAIQALQIRQQTAIENLRFRARILQASAKPVAKVAEIAKVIQQADDEIASIAGAIKRSGEMAEIAQSFIGPSQMSTEKIQEMNDLLERVKTDYSKTELDQAAIDRFIASADNLLAV
jgi:hypothetical protein